VAVWTFAASLGATLLAADAARATTEPITALHEAPPRALHEAPPQAFHEAQPQAFHEAPPQALHEAPPQALYAARPQARPERSFCTFARCAPRRANPIRGAASFGAVVLGAGLLARRRPSLRR
jgi:hypothetical protein